MVQCGDAGEARLAANDLRRCALCARVLKDKYFPNGDLITAKNKRNSSHT